MLEIIEVAEECSQMRTEDTELMTQSSWKQIRQLLARSLSICSVWQYFSVSLNGIPQKCPAGS